MKHKTKPVEIEAIQYTGKNQEEIMRFVGDKASQYEEDFLSSELVIKTLEGDMHASVDDYIIKGLKGEFYPCKPEIFHMKYEAI